MRTSLLACAMVASLAPWSVIAQTPEPFVAKAIILDVGLDFPARRLSGFVVYDLENWTTRPATGVSFILNRLMDASSVRDGRGVPLRHSQDVVRFLDEPMRQVTQLRVQLPRPIPPGGRTTLRIDYAGNLVGYTEIGWLYVKDRIDSSFTILRDDALAFPVIAGIVDSTNRQRPRPDFTYDASVRVPAHWLVALGGEVTRTRHDDGTVTWRYRSGQPASVMNVSIAPFDTLAAEGVHVFYFPEDSAGARLLVTRTGEAMQTFARWFGPLHETPRLTITEIPNGWGSQASLVGGIIQSAAAFRDPSRLGEVYHELSHLWNAPDTGSRPARWNEGLATFLEDLMRERLDGWTGRPQADSLSIASVKTRLARDSTLRRVPLVDYGTRDMTGWSYRVGGLMFATLYELMGEQKFDTMVGGWYQQHPAGGTTRDFVAFAKRGASPDVAQLLDDWVLTTHWTEIMSHATSVADLANAYRATGAR
jgi:hypothetical protein